jgi:hypothetical protein
MLSALLSATHIGARVAPQRCPILRMSNCILSHVSFHDRFERRLRDIFIPDQGTFSIPDLWTFYFTVDKAWQFTPCCRAAPPIMAGAARADD